MHRTYVPDVVIYHNPCMDGFTAAWAAWKRWGDVPRYVPASYGEAPPADLAGKHVLIVDFSYKRPVLEAMASQAASVVVLDHHKTAAADLEGLPTFEASHFSAFTTGTRGIHVLFDQAHSGAGLAFECFGAEETPLLIRLVEDRDLWRFDIAFSRTFHDYLESQPRTFVGWDRIRGMLEDPQGAVGVAEAAGAIRRYVQLRIDELAGNVAETEIEGQVVPVVVAPKVFASEIGVKLLKDHPNAPYAAILCHEASGWVLSLRSEDSRADVSEVARRHGGGGHRNAAGYRPTLVPELRPRTI